MSTTRPTRLVSTSTIPLGSVSERGRNHDAQQHDGLPRYAPLGAHYFFLAWDWRCRLSITVRFQAPSSLDDAIPTGSNALGRRPRLSDTLFGSWCTASAGSSQFLLRQESRPPAQHPWVPLSRAMPDTSVAGAVRSSGRSDPAGPCQFSKVGACGRGYGALKQTKHVWRCSRKAVTFDFSAIACTAFFNKLLKLIAKARPVGLLPNLMTQAVAATDGLPPKSWRSLRECTETVAPNQLEETKSRRSASAG